MSGEKKLCKAATPRFINSHSEFIDVFMAPVHIQPAKWPAGPGA